MNLCNEIFWLCRRLKFAIIAWKSIRGASIHGDTYTAVLVVKEKYQFDGKEYKLKIEVLS
jgi:hypothetical protein